jgi:hypothetical protein
MRQGRIPQDGDLPRGACAAARPRAGRLLCLCLSPLAALLFSAPPAAAVERRVVVGTDGRVALAIAAARSQTSAAAFAARFAATGVIECGGMRGIGQVTGRADRVTSAAHVFFDQQGRSRAEQGRCVFRTTTPTGPVEIGLVPDPGACGSTDPYAGDGRHDWAVARLARPLPGITPYGLAGAPRIGQPIVVVAVEGGERTIDRCRIRDLKPGARGDLEIRTDCVGFDGLSGAAYLADGERPRLLGVHVGFRSRDPDRAGPYGEDHHTFGAAIASSALERATTAAR